MKKVLILLLALVLLGHPVFAVSSNSLSMIDNMPEELVAAIGFSTIFLVSFAEFAYAMYGEVPGMEGTLDYSSPDFSVSWESCDLGTALGDEMAAPGEMIIDSGTHIAILEDNTVHTKMDVIIAYNTGDEIDGTYRVIYQTEKPDYDSGSEEENIIAFTVNDKAVDVALLDF